MAMCRRLQLRTGYKIAYLTQEPDDDDKLFDTVLSSDLREMTLIKTYETLMADYNEANQAKLEKSHGRDGFA